MTLARHVYKNLIKLAASPEHGYDAVKTALKDGGLLNKVEVPALFEEALGTERWKRGKSRGGENINLYEESGPVGPFTVVARASIETAFLEEYQDPEFKAGMVRDFPVKKTFPHLIPGMETIGGLDIKVRPRGESFQAVDLYQDWILTREIEDKGASLEILFEDLYDDSTGQLLSKAGNMGRAQAQNKEIRFWLTVLDENGPQDVRDALGEEIGTKARYNWLDKGPTSTYGDFTAVTHEWDNQVTDALADSSDIDSARATLAAVQHPYTRLPILNRPRHLVVPDALSSLAAFLVSAQGTNRGNITAGDGIQTVGPNFIGGLGLQVVSSPYLDRLMASTNDWFLGDITAAIVHMVIDRAIVTPETLTGEQQRRRVQYAAFCGEYGDFYWWQPRAMVKSTGGS